MTKHLPSPAMVVALIALGVALGGTSLAATTVLVTGTQVRFQKQPPAVNLVKLQQRVKTLEWESFTTARRFNNICRDGKLVASASADPDGRLNVQYVAC